MAFADIELRDNGTNTFDISLSGGGSSGPTGNSNFFAFFDEAFTAPLCLALVLGAGLFWPL
jgi:hypothetical protein